MQRLRLERGRIGISGWKENRLISLSCSRRWAPKDTDAEQIVAKQWLPDYQPYRIKGPLRALQNVFKYFGGMESGQLWPNTLSKAPSIGG